MSSQTTRQRSLVVEPVAGCAPDIGRALWAMQETRRRTLKALEGLPEGGLDAPAPVGPNTIGTLLYHIADAEASWLFEDTLRVDIPPDMMELFPVDHRDEQGILSATRGHTLESYLNRLEVVREKLIEAYREMTPEEFRQVRSFEGQYDVTPEWVLYHLMQHEGEHRGHIHVIVESLK